MNDQNGHRITGIDIPFGDLVLFLIKITLAAVPAGIIVFMFIGLGALVLAIIGAAAGG